MTSLDPSSSASAAFAGAPASLLSWLARHAGVILAALAAAVALGWAFAPELFTSADPYRTRTAMRLKPPSAEHWFGTDYLGRDLYARVVHGAALSLKASVIAVAIGFVAGSAIGLVAGFSRGLIHEALMRFVDILLAVPGLLLALTIVTALGPGTTNIAVAVGVGTVASFARVMRAEVLRVRHCAYVEAAAGGGVGRAGILLRHILPNALGPALVLAGIEFGSAILAVSTLSFLGFGAPPPAPEWGVLVAEGRNYLVRAPWLTIMPGLVVVVVVLATNMLGRFADRRRGGFH